MFLEIPRFDTEFLFSTGLSAGLGSNDIGLDRGRRRRRPHRPVPARRPARHAGAGQPVVPIEQQESARAEVGRGLVRQVDPVGLRRRGGIERPRPRRCHRLLPARCRERRGPPAAGQLPRRSHAQRVLPAQHAQLPEEHRSRHDADLRQRADRRRRRRRRRSDPGAGADRRGRRWRWRWRRIRRRAVLGQRRQRHADA